MMFFAFVNVTPIKLFLTLILGFVIGFTFSQLLIKINDEIIKSYTLSILSMPSKQCNNKFNKIIPKTEINKLNARAIWKHNVNTTENVFKLQQEQQQTKNQQQQQQLINRTLADDLYKEVRVLCWIVTGPKNHLKKAIHVKKTWGSRCNKLLFMSSIEDAQLGTVRLNVSEGRGNLWHKTKEAAKYIYDHHYNDAEWFLKADDDTYVILENLRAFLYPFSSDAPVYFGCKFKPHVRQGYMSGGAGYVMSKEALRRFANEAYPNRTLCRQSHGGSEDKEMGFCLQNVGVVAGDSRDEFKRARFLPSGPSGHIVPKNKSHWYWRYIFYATLDGLNCCSNYAVSFHYIQPDYMYVLDYLIYTLKPFGITNTGEVMPSKQNMSALLEKWRNDVSDNPL